MLRLALGLLLCGALIRPAGAQTVLHHTYEQFVQHQGDSLGDFVEAYPSFGRFVLVFKEGDGLRKVRSHRLWGFTYKGVLFRVRAEGGMPVRLMAHGTICYYENGLAHLEMQRDHKEEAFFAYGERSYLSKDLQGEIVPAHFTEGDDKSASARFLKDHPEFSAVCTCIGDREDMDHTRQCVVDF
ncbi:MAG TPA: hypothetical protein VHL57_08745, partial [Flavobacteriales bacterium]|nr:hypothetical protein [Flavobacteriales bacterium]